MNDPRKRAWKILRDTYWGPRGWKSAGNLRWQPATPADDLAFAVAQGMMHAPLVRSHDDAIRALVAARARLTPTEVGDAFVASLSTRRLEWRSALATYAVARHMPEHGLEAGRGGTRCALCGGWDLPAPHDVNTLNFERHQWGGVRHDDPLYIGLDLEWLAREGVPEPVAEDRALLARVLEVAAGLPGEARPGELLAAVSPVVKGNAYERRALIGVLGYAGVLQPRDRPGYRERFVPPGERTDTPWAKDDWPYPVRWWRGADGVNAAAARAWFGV